MSYVVEENFRYTQNFAHLDQHNKQLPQKNNQPFRQQLPPSHNRPNFSNNHVRPQNAYPVHQYETQQPHFFNQTQFPNRPINLTRNPNPPKQRFLTNSQVFLRPKNAFRPTGQIPVEKPTPMSTTSRNPTIRTQTQPMSIAYRSPQNFNRPNFHRNASKPSQNFISEELYQIDDEQQIEQEPCCFAVNSESDYNNYENSANDIDQTDHQYQPNDELSYQTDNYDYQQTNNDDIETNTGPNFPSNRLFYEPR
ncbi:hypothetical protein Zmor_027916 [Zophobas morio]|uniref:Uncharacterized protein n=1 Tax=Zophobas morio TaxID=2755281 RepID=A0AA38M2X1_9CUCU|nr:hypothetical protein Zmor_027916 [Zophobas morio]